MNDFETKLTSMSGLNKWEIRPECINMVMDYENEKDLAKKVQTKYKFIEWMRENYHKLTDAEIEYLQKGICFVEELFC